MPQFHEMSFLAIFAPHCDVPCASPWPLTPQPMPHLKSIGNTLSYGCKLVSVAQFVQKLFNVAGPLSGLKWPKWPPIPHGEDTQSATTKSCLGWSGQLPRTSIHNFQKSFLQEWWLRATAGENINPSVTREKELVQKLKKKPL